MTTPDLEEEAKYIQRTCKNIEDIRKRHRHDVLELMKEQDADISTLVEILRKTERDSDDAG